MLWAALIWGLCDWLAAPGRCLHTKLDLLCLNKAIANPSCLPMLWKNQQGIFCSFTMNQTLWAWLTVDGLNVLVLKLIWNQTWRFQFRDEASSLLQFKFRRTSQEARLINYLALSFCEWPCHYLLMLERAPQCFPLAPFSSCYALGSQEVYQKGCELQCWKVWKYRQKLSYGTCVVRS